MKRKNQLETGHLYHIFSRSIANFVIFNDVQDYERMIQILKFYQIKGPPISYSAFIRSKQVHQAGFLRAFSSVSKDQANVVQIIAYCLMPTHIHLILKQLQDTGVSTFMGNILNSYSRYFNLRHRRRGPLWESKFHNVLIETDEQLLHLMRYLYLNPVTAFLADRPVDWKFSSYRELIGRGDAQPVCQLDDIMELKPKSYQRFVEGRINYQRELAKIKNLLID